PVHQPAGEPYPDPAARHRHTVQFGRYEVVEGPVQVRQGYIHRHLGHRTFGRRLLAHTPVIPDVASQILRSGDGGRLQVGHPVGALPGEVGQLPTEVPVGRRLLVDRTEQVQIPDDGRRAQVEDLPDGPFDPLHRYHLGAERL